MILSPKPPLFDALLLDIADVGAVNPVMARTLVAAQIDRDVTDAEAERLSKVFRQFRAASSDWAIQRDALFVLGRLIRQWQAAA